VQGREWGKVKGRVEDEEANETVQMTIAKLGDVRR